MKQAPLSTRTTAASVANLQPSWSPLEYAYHAIKLVKPALTSMHTAALFVRIMQVFNPMGAVIATLASTRTPPLETVLPVM